MNRLRNYFREIVGPYLGPDPAATASRYVNALRVVYFFSAGSLLLLVARVVERVKEEEKKHEEETGEESQGDQLLKKKVAPPGLIFSYKSGFKTLEFNKEMYMEQPEKDAIKKESKPETPEPVKEEIEPQERKDPLPTKTE